MCFIEEPGTQIGGLVLQFKNGATLPCSGFSMALLLWCSVGAVPCGGSGGLWPKSQGMGALRPGHFAMVMLGTPARGTSLTVIWNNRYSIWKASRFQRANGPVVFTA